MGNTLSMPPLRAPVWVMARRNLRNADVAEIAQELERRNSRILSETALDR
jgi:hypothetical protein